MKNYLFWIFLVLHAPFAQATSEYSFSIEVTSRLKYPNTPISVPVDFDSLAREYQLQGQINPDSIRVINRNTQDEVPVFWSDSLQTTSKGEIQWAIPDTADKSFEVHFEFTQGRQIKSRTRPVPPIGVGDLLRYNSTKPKPVSLSYPSRILDLNLDGIPDLLGTWNYAYKPGDPYSGIVVYPGTKEKNPFLFGDLVRLRFVTDINKKDFRHFREVYLQAEFADLNDDGLVDLVTCSNRDKQIHCYLNSGKKEDSGFPYFIKSLSFIRPVKDWTPLQIIDFDQDGALDLVLNQNYFRNTNSEGWPMKLASPIPLYSGEESCLMDINDDGHPDSICLKPVEGRDSRDRIVSYRLNQNSDQQTYQTVIPLKEINVFWPTKLKAVEIQNQKGILVQHETYQKLTFFPFNPDPSKSRYFSEGIDLQSESAVLSLSDQAWPYFCDWDDDGDLDLLVGGGYGWPRIVLNKGTNQAPQYSDPKNILANGKPIRLVRDEIFGGKHPHNMGYPFPVFEDWDHDGLPDLLLPNETNRIFWYRNSGTLKKPMFTTRSQIICDGFPDSQSHRDKSAKLSSDRSVQNYPYPYEKDRPFFWRTGAAFADFNSDGLTDLVTHDGFTRKATLFTRYREPASGELRLKKDQPLKLNDGRLIDDKIVNRRSHWTESFHPVDWDQDGLMDLIYSLAGSHNGIQDDGSIYLLRNCGSKSHPVFEPPETMKCLGKSIRITNHGPHPWVGDFDGDTYPDVIPCVEWSVYPFYRHAAIQMDQPVRFTTGPLKKPG